MQNGRTRIYVMASEGAVGRARDLYVLDRNGEVNARATVRNGAVVDVIPKMISYPDYTIAYGNCVTPLACRRKM